MVPVLRARDMDLHGEFASALAGHYDIERELGRGGMAVVYLARDLRHGREVALKVIHPELASTVGAERFLREVAITAPLVHPNIVPVLDSGEAAGQLYYAMPYVEGETLRQRLDRETQLPIDDAVAIAREVAEALDYAHARGIVHRDIKPDNILLCGSHALVADFGLARAITSASSTPLTRGVALGTPAYMSPEQCTPGRAPDARSDIYSLACVLFEMIAGQTPFRGATVEIVIAHHLASAPPSLCEERASCPPHMDGAVRQALAKVPADRFRTAGAFVDALGPAQLPAPGAPPPRGHRKVAWGAMIAAATVLLGWLGVRQREAWVPLTHLAAVDTTRVALLPLEGAPAGGPYEELLYEAFARWQGVALVDPFQVADAVRQHGRIGSEADAQAIARSLGAGRYVRARVIAMGPSSTIHAGLYQVGEREPLQVATVRLGDGGTRGAVGFQFLADSLLLRGASVDDPPAPGARRSLTAVRAFATGQAALDDWDLARADSAFGAAQAADPAYARANLWLAQVRAWNRRPADEWRSPARQAQASEVQLGEHDRGLARALVLLANGHFAAACHDYDELRARNPRDFAAWFGLGQCRTMDRTVLPDASSPSGWRFRSSWGAGLAAYEQALELLPTVHRGFRGDAFESLRALLLTDRDRLVTGYAPSADSGRFFGRLSLDGDSLRLVPYPSALIISGAAVYPAGFEQAISRQRQAFRTVASAWATALPRAAAAKEALALSLEMLGDASAADTLALARRLSADATERLQLGAAEVFVRVKFGIPDDTAQIRRARALGDSLVAGTSLPDPPAAVALAAVAELLGRCDRAVALARHGAQPTVLPTTIPRSYHADAAELRIRVTLDCLPGSVDSALVAMFNRIARDPAFRGNQLMARDILLVSTARLAFPLDPRALALLAMDGNSPLISAMDMDQRGDTVGAHAALTRMQAGRVGIAPPALEAGVPEARLILALHDPTGSLRLLRALLANIPNGEPRALELPARPGSLVRGMLDLAALEDRFGDRARGLSWATSAAILRAGGDRARVPPTVR